VTAANASGAIQSLQRPEPIIRADALAHVVFERRDMEAMSRFLVDFGFRPCDGAGGPGRQFRSYGALPYSVELIPSTRDAFVGFAIAARDAADLQTLAANEDVSVEPADGPGGGSRVRLIDPDGRRVDLVHGVSILPPLPARQTPPLVNTPFHSQRIDAPVRTPVEPAPVFRLGHVVLQTPDFQATSQWYMRRFGFLPSDVLTLPDGSPALGFFRFDRGPEPSDHHSLAILEGPAPALLHVSTETLDIEAVGQGHYYLHERGWTHYWGLGRHLLGSQIFDYWKDPAGDEWEHYADGDLMTAEHPTGYHALDRGGLWTWGDDLPDSMRPMTPPPDGAPARARAAYQALSTPPRPWLL
jgi:catechol 2,3-dioxygenase-like lactoylglutathione lyase family enzyme